MDFPLLNGARILVVEDEPLIALELMQTIEDAGGIIAGSPRSRRDALDLADRGDVHVALLDVRLSDGTSFEVADRLTARGIPFLFCTADGEDRSQFSAWPGVPVIAKPHRPEVMLDALSSLLLNRR